jgi:hypothetical protein
MKNYKTLLVLTLIMSFTSCVYSQAKKQNLKHQQ